MPKIDVDAVLAAKAPRIARWVPGFVIRWLKRTIHQDEINYILDEYSALPPQQFIQACFKFWGVTYSVEGLENLDPKGRYLFASNHPFGGNGRYDAGRRAGRIFRRCAGDRERFADARRAAATALDSGEQARFAMRGIPAQVRRSFRKRLSDSDLPGRLCSRRRQGVVSDLPWRSNFVKRAAASGRRIVPVFVEGELSDFFYRLSNFRTKIGIRFNIEMLYLPDEMFSQKGKHFRILVGEPVSTDELVECGSWQQRADYVREKAYSLEKKLRAEAKHG